MKQVRRRVVFLLAACMAIGFHSARAQDSRGAIEGKVSDSSGGVIPGASITIQPGKSSVTSDALGHYKIANIAAGNYTVTVTFEGFTSATVSVSVSPGQTATADASLTPAGTPQHITVSAPVTEADAQAVADTRSADNIIQMLPAQEIKALPNYNVAEALGRLPGVSLERDEGEGKYVQVRGTEPRLTNTTIDGINVPSPEGGVRQVKLDTIPSDLVESVSVNKTLDANMDGDGIGGSVNLKTKMASDVPSLSMYAIGGGDPIQGGVPSGQFGATIGKRFMHNKLGALFGYTFDYNGRGIDDMEPVPGAVQNADGSLTPFFSGADFRNYRYDRSRWGFGGSTDYRFGDNSDIYIRGLYSDFKDYGDRWVYTVNSGAAPSYNTSTRTPDYGIVTVSLGGNHEFATRWFHWDFAFARSREFNSAGDPSATFNATGYLANSTGCVFDPAATTNIYLPQFSPNCFKAGPDNVFDTTQYALNTIEMTYGQTAQLNLSGSAEMGQHYRAGSASGTFQFGFKIRNGHKFDDSYVNDFAANGTVPFTLFQNPNPNPGYYDNKEPFGPGIAAWPKITAYLAANPGQFTETSTFGGNANNFSLQERVTAGYLMNTLDFSRFRLVAGVRFEGTNVNTLSFDTVANTLSAVAGGSYVDVLPSASLRYRIDQNSDIRIAYSRALARPDPQDLTSAVTLDTTTNPFTYSIGNPALKPEHANNYDLLYEYYLKPLGLVEAGYFYKQLSDPIIFTTMHPTAGQYSGFIVQEPGNAGSAWVTGFEASYQQPFKFLPYALQGFGIMANYLYTASEADGLQGRSDHPALLRQSPNIYNIIPSYDRGRFSVRVAMQYNGASIYQYNYQDGAQFGIKGPNGDNYLFSHFQLDAQASIRITNGLTAIVYGQNLTNEPFGFYNGSIQYMNQREFYKPTYAAGVRWNPAFRR